MPARARGACAQRVTSRPSNSMRPLLVGSSPLSRLISVDLPAPFVPMTACTSPTCRSSATPLTAARPPKRRVSPLARSSGVPLVDTRVSGIAPPAHPCAHADQPLGQQRYERDDREAQAELPV